MCELKDFIKISKYSGERFDLIQAGGGNSSVKDDNGRMYIKASGVFLSEVDEDFGYAIVKNEELLKIFEDDRIYNTDKRSADKIMSEYMTEVNLTPKFRPSIETLLHSMLQKYTLHTHPILVNAITNRADWKNVLEGLFGSDIILANYKTPGLSLALELKDKIKNKNPNIIFLQNHGLIITSNHFEDIKKLTEYVLDKIEKYLNADMSIYKLTNEVSEFVNEDEDYKYVSYLSEDKYLNEKIESSYLTSLPFCPDKMVYCGVKPLVINDEAKELVNKYKKEFYDVPKVVVYKNRLFFVAKNTKKAKEIEDVFKFHIMSLELNKDKNINYLTNDEIKYIGNWEAEKYRQNL